MSMEKASSNCRSFNINIVLLLISIEPISLPLNYGVNKEQSEYSKPKVNNK